MVLGSFKGTYLHTYLLNYLLIPWYRFLLEKLTGLQLVKKFPAFHRTWRFITALTGVRFVCCATFPLETLPTQIRVGEYFTSGLFCLQGNHPACECFWTCMFYREGLLAPRPNPKLEDHPSSAVHYCLFNLFAAFAAARLLGLRIRIPPGGTDFCLFSVLCVVR